MCSFKRDEYVLVRDCFIGFRNFTNPLTLTFNTGIIAVSFHAKCLCRRWSLRSDAISIESVILLTLFYIFSILTNPPENLQIHFRLCIKISFDETISSRSNGKNTAPSFNGINRRKFKMLLFKKVSSCHNEK